MFKDENLEPVNITSDILTEKYVRDQSCQTSKIEYQEKSSQSVQKVSSEAQTENAGVPVHSTRLHVDTSKKLSNFMLIVYPMVSEQLTANIRSHAFDDYQLEESMSSDEICSKFVFTSPPNEDLQPTCLSWNSMGSIIGSAYGCFEHISWCTHPSYIFLWNLNSKENKEPDKVIDTDNCITALSFHPKDPPLLLGGDFSGKLYMWDLSREDNILAAFTGKESEIHQESVNAIIWMPSAGSIVRFMTAGSDGNLHFWMYNKLKRHIGLLSSFQLTSDVLPRNVRKTTMRTGVAIGVTCAVIPFSEKNEILVGMENGDVYNCKESANGFTVFAFEGHRATVNAISMSNQNKTWFASCSLDMSIHIYDVFQVLPFHRVDPLCGHIFDLKWSLSKDTIYVTTSKGKILMYDIDLDSAVLKKIIDCADKSTAINVLAVNYSDSQRFASSDSKGEIKVWEIC